MKPSRWILALIFISTLAFAACGQLQRDGSGPNISDIATSYGSDNLAHGIFGAANTPTTGAGTTCRSTLDNCRAPIDTFTPGLASGALSGASDQVLFRGNGNTNAENFWNLVNNEGIQHRD